MGHAPAGTAQTIDLSEDDYESEEEYVEVDDDDSDDPGYVDSSSEEGELTVKRADLS